MNPTESGPSPIPRPADSAARRLHPSNDEALVLDTGVLGAIAAGLAEAIDEVPTAAAGTIDRILLLSTEGYDAWLMVWGPGATLEAHDHDGSIGVMHVLHGELLEAAADLEAADLTPRRRLVEGENSEFAAAYRHALLNPADGTAVSIGVYSPPLGGAASAPDV